MNNGLPEYIHFVGIGGIGMSGLAEFLHKEGHYVTGSDLKKSENTRRLKKMGIPICYSHEKSNIGKAALIVYSSAIPADNPERQILDIPTIKRATMLNRVMKKRPYQIAVCGMHGKTTCSSILTHIFTEAGKDPSALLGGILQSSGTNIRYGEGDYCIVEADEYDRSFMELYPTHGLMTNIEAEHLDIYNSLQDIKNTFSQFGQRVSGQNNLVVCADDENIRDILDDLPNAITYGIESDADYQATNLQFDKDKSSFDVIIKGEKAEKIEIGLPGQHNILNALGCLAIADQCELELDKIKSALASYAGSKRRLEVKYKDDDVILIDDYAHHPTEIKATLQGLKQSRDNRIIAIFQPHLYSRTRDFHKEFARVLKIADQCFVAEIYPAREKPIEGVTSKMITDLDKDLEFCSKGKIVDKIIKIMQPGDIIITLGAGDINTIHEELTKIIRQEKE